MWIWHSVFIQFSTHMMHPHIINCLLLFLGAILVAADDCTLSADGCSIKCDCFDFSMVKFSAVDEISTSITFVITNNCKMEVSYIAIGTGNLTVLSPQNGEDYTSDSATYGVTFMQLSGNPGFPSVKFSRKTGSHCCEISQTFTLLFELPASQMAIYPFMFQGHAGTIWNTAGSYQPKSCECADCDQTCKPGFGGSDCAQCADPASTPGYSYWCVPQDSNINPYTLQLLPCSLELGNCPSTGFSPFQTTSDDGYTITCDCQRVTYDCPSSCSGNGICNDTTGTCQCLSGTLPDCATPPSVEPTCQTYQNCSGNGICDAGNCNCTQGFEGPSCNFAPPQKCNDLTDCSNCTASSLGCSWCIDALGNPSCSNTTLCPSTNQVSCVPGTVVYQHEPCPDECSGHGECQNGECNCDSNWEGVNCSQPSAVTLGAGIGAVVVALIVIGAIVAAVISTGGSYAAYKKMRSGPLTGAHTNPLYNDEGKNGVNPFYQEPTMDA